MMQGRVYIVGAGPGAADLLTVRAASLLRSADVVLHDDLVPQEILDLIAPSANVINVGKRCGRHTMSQEEISKRMVQLAQYQMAVVRLKSGDPAVFGRLGEELDALREAGIPFEIVPGVTAATAAAAAANLTLTDRRTASALVILTAHNCRRQSLAGILFDPEQTTYALYMPGPDYAATGKELLRAGLDPGTPCALISHAGRERQQTKFLALSGLQSVTAVVTPAILIVGNVAARSSVAESAYLLDEISASIQTAIQNPA